MKCSHSTAELPRQAFTLVELLGALLIIIVLVGLVITLSGYASKRARESTTRAELAALEAALHAYKMDWGHFPITPTNRYPYQFADPQVGNRLANSAVLYRALAGISGGKQYYAFDPGRLTSVNLSNYISGWNQIVTYYRCPYGSAYNYYCRQPPRSDQINVASFDLWSSGPDQRSDIIPSREDDVTNWRK